MILGKLYNGSGLGNQLFRYITVRTKAERLRVPYAMVYIDDHSGKEPGFKGSSFMKPLLSTASNQQIENVEWNYFNEKKIVDENGVDIRSYDPEFYFVKENTVIDGEFQDERYWQQSLPNIDKWLNVQPLDVPDNKCIIGFRGGEYQAVPDLFLPKEYWDMAISWKRKTYPGDLTFEVHTDDVETAKKFFPDFECIHDIGVNWRSVRYARHAIIANSSFYILPRLLMHNENRFAGTIAPRYWGRYNTKTWALPQNFYKEFTYIHHEINSDRLRISE